MDYETTDNETPASLSEHDELTRKLRAWFAQDMPHVYAWRKEAREDYEFYNGDQWNQDDLQHLRENKRPALTFNRIGPLVNAVVGSEINNRREVQFIPREQGDAIPDELLTSAGEWFRDEGDAEDEESVAFYDTVICGMGVTDTSLDYETDPDGKPCVRRLDPLKMGWDCNSVKDNLIDANRVWYIDEKPFSEVQEMFPGVPRELLHAGWAKVQGAELGPHDQDQADLYEGGQNEFVDQYSRKMCTLVECRWFEKEPYYRGPDIENPQATREYSTEQMKLVRKQYPEFPAVKQTRKVVKRAFIGAQVLEAPDKPNVPPGMFGWEFITGYHDKMKNMFYGIVRPAKDPQRWSNKFLSQTQFLLNSQSKGGIMAERGAFEDDREAEASWAKSDAITYLKNGALTGPSPKVIPKPVAQFPSGFFTLFNESKESISQVTGLSPEFIGTREVDQAGVLEAQRKQSSLNLLASLFNSLRRYRKRQGKVVLFLIQNFLSDGRLIKIVGDDKSEYVPLVKTASKEYDIIIDDSPTSPNEKERTFAIIQQMLPLMGDMLTPELMLEILTYSPLPASLIAKWKKKAQEAAEAAAQQPQPPSPEEQKMQLEQAKGEIAIQKSQVDLQATQQKAELDAQAKTIDLVLKQRQAELDAVVAQRKLEVDLQKLAVQEEQNRIKSQNANSRAAGSANS